MEVTQPILPCITPSRAFEDHEGIVFGLAVFPDGRRLVTGSMDRTLHLRDLQDGGLLKKMEGHLSGVRAVAVSQSGRLIASGGGNGEFISWDGDHGKSLKHVTDAHSGFVFSVDFSPDGALLATGSDDKTTKLWSTETWQPQGNPIDCHEKVFCVRYSPSGDLLAIATSKNIQIWKPCTRERIAKFTAAITIKPKSNASLAWMPDGSRLFSGGSKDDPTVREWDTSTWKQVGDPWKGHTRQISAIAVNSAATLIASASHDSHVRLWRLSDRQTIAIFEHSDRVCCATFSRSGEQILSGGLGSKVLEWAVPEDVLLEDTLNTQVSNMDALQEDVPEDQVTNEYTSLEDPLENQVSNVARGFDSKILAINTKVRNACIAGDLHAAEELLTQEIDTDPNNYSSYANRSFVVARKLDWERALHHAVKSVSIQPSLIGYISKGIALCRQQHFQDAMKAIDLAFMFTDGDSNVAHFLLLIKAILMFNGNQHDDAMMRVQELADACPDADTLACRVVEAYLLVQLGTRASDDARHNEAADHFAAAIKTGAFSSGLAIHSIYEDLVVLFGWDLKILWQTTNQKRCHALLQAGKLEEAVESYRYMMDMSDDSTKADCLHWSTDFTQECSVLCAYNGDTAHEASNYDRAIDLYSAAIKLDSENDIIFEKRSRAKLGKMLWEEALLDAQKVVELNPSSHIGYQLKREALHGAHRYDEAIDAFQIMLSKMDNAPETHIRKLRQQYLSPSEVEDDIRNAIHAQLDDSPLRLLNTSIGRLCDRDAQMNIFKASTQYKELLSLTMKHEDLHLQHIEEAVGMYFRCVMLSHRWEKKEPLLHDIQEKAVYELDPVGGIIKLQSFCKIVRELGYHWAWSDTCCIDKINHVELQESLNSMFVWYRHSALTIVYLSDVPPSSKSGALARSVWNTRGWTVPEFLAPKVILFYQNDWSPYLDDRSPNHKESVAIMQELGDATGIHPEALVAFQAGMSGAREKLKWASTRVTTRHEDIAYSLFGVFGVRLPVDYGEKKEMALGRLLQEIVAQSGDITALDWVGKSSEFNSCLPADITSYQDSPCTPSSLSEDDIRTSVSSLQNIVAVELASKLYTMLDNLSSPRFTNRRLHLPCITFSVTEIRRLRHSEETYRVQADGLHDLLITTEDKLISFSVARPLSAGKNFLLVCPWNRSFLELSDPADDRRSIDDLSVLEPPLHDSFGGLPRDNEPIDMESHPRALRLIVRLGQPFSAFLLARQLSGEYKRIASDRHIIAQIKDMASIHDMMGSIRTLEIS